MSGGKPGENIFFRYGKMTTYLIGGSNLGRPRGKFVADFKSVKKILRCSHVSQHRNKTPVFGESVSVSGSAVW